MSEALSLERLVKRYRNGVTALADVSLALHEGECLALLGPNGAGKTTLIKIATGLLRADEGQVYVKGKEYFPGDSRSRLFGVGLQEIGVWPHLTVSETIEFIGSLYRVDAKLLTKKRSELLQAFALVEYEHFRFSELSEGLKRRLNIACALVHDPEIVILDEPSLGLDVHARHALWQYLESLLQRSEISILLSTHDMEEAERLGRRIGILDHGKLLALGTLGELKSRHSGDEIRLQLSKDDGMPQHFFNELPGVSEVSTSDRRISLKVDDGIRRFPLITQKIIEAGNEIEEISLHPITLGDIFLNITGRSLG